MKIFFYLGTILTLLLQAAIVLPSSASTPDASASVLAVEVTIRYVDVDASGANDGSTWQDAFTSLQPALEAAASGEQIWVAAGTYLPTVEHCGSDDDRFKSFQLKQGVALYGGFDPTSGATAWEDRDFVSHLTVLDGDIGTLGDPADNSYHVFCHPNDLALDASAILDGFTITRGNANADNFPHYFAGGMYNDYNSPALANVTFLHNTASISGGGMINNNHSNPTLAYVTFAGNTAKYGGGMYNSDYSSPTLTHVTFLGNVAIYAGGMINDTYSSPTLTDVSFLSNAASNNGGGMINHNYSSPILTNVTFSGNTAALGGGMYNYISSSPTLMDVTFSDNTASYNGGGMYNLASNPTLTNVTFSENTASSGGGLYNETLSNPTLAHVSFSGNTASNGGGMYNKYSSPILVNVSFSGNTVGIEGGGMLNKQSSPILTDVTFTGNTAARGGGMYNYADSSPTLANVSFCGNTADLGGGVFNYVSSSPTLTNVTFAGNTAALGGGMYNHDDSSPTLTNVTFYGNTAVSGGGMYNLASSPTLTNAILWGNAPDQISNDNTIEPYSSPVVTYSDIQGGYAGTGNLDLDPKFYRAPSSGLDGVWGTPDDDYGDLRLQPASPAIDAGNNAAVPAGITTDLSGAPRFVDLPTIPDTGAGDPPLVDLGAYEAQITIPLHLPLILR